MPENDLDDATQKNKLASLMTRRRSLSPNLHPKPTATQNISTIAEGLEHATFGDILEVELQHPANKNTSTTATRSSQNVKGASSTQTNRGTPRQSSPWAPSPIQAIQENAEIKQLQVEDW
jgi:hypothetical protein